MSDYSEPARTIEHLGCGGLVNLDADFPQCSKCCWSGKTVLRENAKKAATPAKENEVWWNRKRFTSEREALLHHSDKALDIYLSGNLLWMEAKKKPFDATLYQEVIELYTKAAKVARDDDDLVSESIYGSMENAIRNAAKEHEAAEGD